MADLNTGGYFQTLYQNSAVFAIKKLIPHGLI